MRAPTFLGSPAAALRRSPVGTLVRRLTRYHEKHTAQGTWREDNSTGLFEATAAAGPLAGLRFGHVRATERDTILYGTMEPTCTQLVAGLDLRGEAAIDVGACYGYYSLLLARAPGAGAVYALEPDVANLARLAANARINGCANVLPIGAAASATAGVQLIVAVEGAPWDSHLSVVSERAGGRATSASPAPTITLDDLAAATGARIAFVKIDAEGVEADVLRGASGLLRGDRPALLLELHADPAESGVQELLEASGYVWRRVEHVSETRSHVLAFHPDDAARYEAALARALSTAAARA